MGHNRDDVRSAAELLLDTPSSAHALQLNCTATESCFMFKLIPPVSLLWWRGQLRLRLRCVVAVVAQHGVACCGVFAACCATHGPNTALGSWSLGGACSTHAYGGIKDGMQLHHHVFFPTASGGNGLALYSAPREHAVSLVQILEHVLPNNAAAHYPLYADTPLRGGR